MKTELTAQEEVNIITDTAKKCGIQENHLCKEAGINLATLWRWQVGKSDPSYTKFKDLQKALKTLQSKHA